MGARMNQRYYTGENAFPAREWFERTGEFRAPRKGEYYLSGAIACAYRAHKDLSAIYHIMRKVAPPPKRVTVDGFSYVLEGPC